MTRRGFWKKLGMLAGASVIPTKMLPNVSSKYPVIIDKLTTLQLWRAGFPVDPWTIGKSMDLDLGPFPEKATTVMERWIAWKRVQRELTKESNESPDS